MNLDQARQLVSQLGLQIGGDDQTYEMDEQGEAHFVFENRIGVMVKHHRTVLVLSCTVAENISDADPGLFSTLMGYQYMGLRTVGAVLSWNSDSDTLVLSRMLHGEPDATELMQSLNLLLRTADVVREEIGPVLEGNFKFDDDELAPMPAQDQGLSMFNRA